MRIKFDFAETSYYRLDIELPQDVLEGFCEQEGISVDDILADPESYAYDIGHYLAQYHEDLGDELEFRTGEGVIHNPKLEI